MFAVLVLLFLVLPILELYVIIQVAGGIGGFQTVGLLILVSVVGAWLVRREGLSVLRRGQEQLSHQQMPTKQIVDGGLIMLAGALMLTPGFITDGVGVLLLVPPTRIAVRHVLMRRFKGRFGIASMGAPTGFRSGPVYDVSGSESDHVDLNRNDDPLNPPSLP